MNENTGNVEPAPKTDLDGDPFPVEPTDDPVTEAGKMVTPNTPQVVPPKGVGVQEFKEEKLREAAEHNQSPKESKMDDGT